MVSNLPVALVYSDHFQVNPKNGKKASMISEETYKVVKENATTLDSAIIYDRDFNYNLYASTIKRHSATYLCSALVLKPLNGRTY